jgi:transposase
MNSTVPLEQYQALEAKYIEQYQALEAKYIEQYQALEAKYIEQYQDIEAKYNQLQHELAQLKRMIFGSRSEKFIPSDNLNQLELDFGQLDLAALTPIEKESITYERNKKNHPGRTALPENIPTEDIIIEPTEDTTDMVCIGEEVTETVDYKPGILLKRRYIRRKYAQRNASEDQNAIVIGEMPDRPIPKGIAEAGLLAYIWVSKFVDHLPFYRQIEMFKRQFGWSIHKSTLNDWLAACCSLLDALYVTHTRLVIEGYYLQADESPIKVLDRDKPGSTHQGYMWVVRNPLNGLVLFKYRKGRGADGIKELLSEFNGYLQCDGYKAYESFAKKGNVTLISCMAHIRRKFYDAQDHHPEYATEALSQIAQLYEVERQSRNEGNDPIRRQALRQEQSREIYNTLLAWVEERYKNNLHKGAIGSALHYAYKQLPKLESFLEDGQIEIDNNLTENSIRPLALGRKNYLFAGSHEGGQRAAMMYSFFASCKYHDVNPLEWLTYILNNISKHPVNQLEDLLPHKYKLMLQES